MKRVLLTAAMVAMVSCARLPKPAEMTQYEGERKARAGEELKLEHPELVQQADAQYAKAVTAHDDKEEDLLAHHAHLTSLWWQSANLRRDTRLATESEAEIAKETAQLETSLAEAKKRQKLAKSTLDRMAQIIALEGKVTDSQDVNTARGAINEALAALKEAQAVDADTHAATSFAAAEAKLKAATDALGKNKTKDAQSFAIEAKAAAETAKREAQPKYATTEADQAKLNRQKALFDALGSASGAQRSMVENGVRVTIVEVFAATGGITILPVMEGSFSKIAETAKAFPEYALVIEAHTDSKGNKSKNLQLSESRAKSVAAFLAGQGVAPDRMTSLGKGSVSPVADNKTQAGRAQNRRIELLFVPSSK